jgi:hypothetical protein
MVKKISNNNKIFQKIMVVQDIKPLVKGIAQLQYIMSGGIAIYHILSIDNKKYQMEIDLSNKNDVGETAAFKPTEKAILFMRWIRKANDNDTLIEIK